MKTTVEYKLGDDILNVIQNTVYNILKREDFTGPKLDKDIIIETGLGGWRAVDIAIKNMAIQSGLVVSASDLGKISGTTAGVTYMSYTIPFLANIKFILNPDMDNNNGVEHTADYYINGFIPSSYSYRIKTSVDIVESIADIICTGKKPIFRHELSNIINSCGLSTEYGISTHILTTYIMNCLKNLK